MNSTIKTVYALVMTAVFSMAADLAVAAPKADLWERWDRHDAQSTITIDHGLWNDFLSRYVFPNTDGINRVEYSAVKRNDFDSLESYIAKLSEIEISLYNHDEQRAFWINLYNALTVREILKHYPVSSIQAVIATTELESRPPDRNAPTGTSATSWRRTAVATLSANALAITSADRPSTVPS